MFVICNFCPDQSLMCLSDQGSFQVHSGSCLNVASSFRFRKLALNRDLTTLGYPGCQWHWGLSGCHWHWGGTGRCSLHEGVSVALQTPGGVPVAGDPDVPYRPNVPWPPLNAPRGSLLLYYIVLSVLIQLLVLKLASHKINSC